MMRCDKIMKFWYDKNEENIEKYKCLIMLDLEKEEVDRKIRNTELKEAREQGIEYGEKNRNLEIAKNLLSLDIPIDKTIEATGLSEEEIGKIKT